MKRTKKLFALALALLVAFSTLVTPAMAAGEDGIMPMVGGHDCPSCAIGYATSYTRTETDEVHTPCYVCEYAHLHEKTYRRTYDSCNRCSYNVMIAETLLTDVCRHPL